MENTIIIKNPPIFINENYLKKYALKKDYSKGQAFIIYRNELPREILITFDSPELCDKFIKDYNQKSFQKLLTYKLIIEKFTGTKDSEIAAMTEKYPDYKEIPYKLKYELMYKNDYDRTYYEPGLVFLDEKQKELTYEGVKWLLKKIGSNVLAGQSVMTISLPVFIFDQRTMHEVFAYEHKLAPYFLSKAYYSRDSLERLKWLVVYLSTTLHITTINSKPFNPIIGETFQTKIGDLNIYTEQTANHPITSNFYCFNDDKDYKLYGYLITIAQTGTNSVEAIKKGKYIIEFKDGEKYTFYLPGILLDGAMVGKRTYNYKDKMLIVDHKNQRCAYVGFNPDKVGFFQGLFSKKQNTYPDTFLGDIVNLKDVTISEKDNNHKICNKPTKLISINGEWTSFITFDGDDYWNIDDYKYFSLFEVGYKCPSDGKFRTDLTAFSNGDLKEAQNQKDYLENLQRKDRKLRAEWAAKK